MRYRIRFISVALAIASSSSLAGATLGAPLTVSRLETQSQPAPVVEAALRSDSTKLPALVGVDLGSTGYAVVRVVKAVPRPVPAPDAAKAEGEQFAQAVGAAENAAYYALLKQRFNAEILVPRPVDATPVTIR